MAKLVKKIRQRLVEQLLKPTRSIDYQSVKITNAAEQRGIDVVVYAANLHDTKSGILVTRKVMAQHPTIKVFSADSGYRKSFGKMMSKEF